MTKIAKLLDDLKHRDCKRENLTKQGDSLLFICFISPKAMSYKEVAMVALYTSCNVKEEFI